MPTVLCSWCTKPTVLPDDWTRPAYACPHCTQTVTVARSIAGTSAEPEGRRLAPRRSALGLWAGCAAVAVLSVAAGLLSARGDWLDVLKTYVSPPAPAPSGPDASAPSHRPREPDRVAGAGWFAGR